MLAGLGATHGQQSWLAGLHSISRKLGGGQAQPQQPNHVIYNVSHSSH